MKSITEIFTDAIDVIKKKYKYIYIAIDIHGTIFYSLRQKDEKFIYLPNAKKALQLLSENPCFKLILFTSSYRDNIQKYLAKLKEDNIHFDFIMENPEIKSNEYANFSQKFYFDILIDDKAGFENEDWAELTFFLKEKFG